MNDAETLAKLRIDYSLILKEQADQVKNYADNLARQGELIRKGEHEEAIANDLVMELHTIILRMQKTINELEALLKVKNEKITEPRKVDT